MNRAVDLFVITIEMPRFRNTDGHTSCLWMSRQRMVLFAIAHKCHLFLGLVFFECSGRTAIKCSEKILDVAVGSR